MRKNERKYFAVGLVLVVFLMAIALYVIWDDPEDMDAAQSTATTTESVPASTSTMPGEADMKPSSVKTWLKQNSARMSSYSSADEEKMEDFVAALTAADFIELKNLVLDQTQPAQDRILSTYLLNLAGQQAGTALGDLIQSPLNAPTQAAPHTIDEATSSREKALRVMAVDHLANRAKTDAQAKKQFKELIPGIQEPWVKNYAERRLREIK